MSKKVELRASTFREKAREAIKGKGKTVFYVGFIYLFFVMIIPTIFDLIFSGQEKLNLATNNLLNENVIERVKEKGLNSEIVSELQNGMGGNIASLIFTILTVGAFIIGVSIFSLAILRKKEDAKIGLLFSGFDIFFKSIRAYVLYSIFVFLHTLPFILAAVLIITIAILATSLSILFILTPILFMLAVVFGVIAMFKYSMAFLIIADDTSISASQALKKSKDIMKGNKGKLFFLQLSFIGWGLLAILITIIISVAMSFVVAAAFYFSELAALIAISILSSIIFAAVFAILVMYMQIATAAFYEEIISDDPKKIEKKDE
ncbi:MAG: DUF975 family protein [Clostridiales Family XIII bacterium]|jgi:uncharacterized membrane protein|nr:DUF975 family protein [Clostridiales Family XIII bacterium]